MARTLTTLTTGKRAMNAFFAIFLVLLMADTPLAEPVPFDAPPVSENLALGRPYTIVPAPNYPLCTDEGDATQLTDGEYTSPSDGWFWTEKSTVGISKNVGLSELELITITIDLGKEENILGFSYNMAAGRAGVAWPEFIRVFTSLDGKEWACVGDLYAKSKEERGGPEPDVYSVYRAASLNMPSQGRYVTFQLDGNPFAFVDEIEIYRSPKDESQAFASYEKTTNPADMSGHILYRTCLLGNIANLEENLARTPVPGMEAMSAGLEQLRRRAGQATEEEYAALLTVLPITAFQREIFHFNCGILQANGLKEPLFWHNCRWDNLSPTAMPAGNEMITTPVMVDMMRNEVRSEAINLLNPTEDVLRCTLMVKGLPIEAHVELRQVIFTDTKLRQPVSGALKPWTNEYLELEIPSGTSAQLWFSFRKPTLPAGRYDGFIVADYGGRKTVTAPIALRIRDLDFPDALRLHIGGWDYIQSDGLYHHMGDCRSHVQIMRSFGADTFCATNSVIPSAAEFDPNGNLVNSGNLVWTNWEKWLETCPGGRLYFVFVNVQPTFYGEPINTPRFRKMVSDFYRAWFEGIEARGLKKEQIVLHLLDESVSREQDLITLAYADAIHAAIPDACTFANPTHFKPEDGMIEMYEAVDILCPNATAFLSIGKPFRDFYARQRANGRRLWLYSCSGPSRLLDPVAYYRAAAWLAFDMDGDGIGFWAFGDGGGIGDSWHAYAQTYHEYSPYFVSPTGTMEAKQSEGIFEGAEDFEYLSMLKERIAENEKTNAHADILPEAKEFLATAPSLAIADYDREGSDLWTPNAILWKSPKDRTVMDTLRVRVLDMLENLR